MFIYGIHAWKDVSKIAKCCTCGPKIEVEKHLLYIHALRAFHFAHCQRQIKYFTSIFHSIGQVIAIERIEILNIFQYIYCHNLSLMLYKLRNELFNR